MAMCVTFIHSCLLFGFSYYFLSQFGYRQYQPLLLPYNESQIITTYRQSKTCSILLTNTWKTSPLTSYFLS